MWGEGVRAGQGGRGRGGAWVRSDAGVGVGVRGWVAGLQDGARGHEYGEDVGASGAQVECWGVLAGDYQEAGGYNELGMRTLADGCHATRVDCVRGSLI